MAERLATRYRTALVTGASTGLGRAFATMLLSEGVAVWGTSREAGRLGELAQAHPGSFHPVVMELGEADAVARVFREAEQAAGGFDLVVNNAGYGVFGTFAEVDFSVWREQLNVMLVNTALVAHLALPGLKSRGRGALVNVSSLAAEFPLPFQSAYNMTKAGLTALSESLMIECAGTGVAVIDLRPGDFRTEFEGAVRRPPAGQGDARLPRVWAAFEKMMQGGPAPEAAAAALRQALQRGKSGTVRCGRLFQAVLAPLLARLGSLPLKRRIQAGYFDLD
jgi:short-subunit dehydrogenase